MRNVEYTNSVSPNELIKLWDLVGWDCYNDDILRAEVCIKNTDHIICAKIDGKVVGLLLLLTNYAQAAYIESVCVHPDFQSHN